MNKSLFMKRAYLIFIVFTGLLLNSYSQTLNLPPRNLNAYTGSQIISLLTPLSLDDREDSIFVQIISGNVPDFIRTLIPISDTVNISGTDQIVTYFVTPDYMALGCDTDYFLCPMTPLLAQKVCDYLSCTMPSRKMVNDIWQNATVKLSPQPIAPSPQMTTVPVFADHNAIVWTSRSALIATHPLGELVGGDKKDVVISNIIYGNPAPGRVVIYGWHQLNGSPIQPLYAGHEETYADYSHGIRLVQNEMYLNSCISNVQSILQSSTFNPLLSDEGVISVPRYPVSTINVEKPTSFCVLSDSPGSIQIIAKADANVSGYNVAISYDGKCFGLPNYYSGNNFNISPILSDSVVFVKLSAIGVDGSSSAYSEVLAAYSSQNALREYLVINGFDRTTSGNTYNFIIQHGFSIKSIDVSFSSATNEAITESLILLGNFDACDYMLGEESTADETFSDEEQIIISDYLDNGGKLFVSGSEIGWDLDHLGSVSDKSFFNNYLFSNYIEDTPNNQASTYYSATFNTPNNSPYSFSFDDGTNGTYDVRYPDVVSQNNIGPLQGESIGSFDAYPAKSLGTFYINKLVYLTIPIETIYPESSRNIIFDQIDQILFFTTNIEDISDIEFEIYPNPAKSFFNLNFQEESFKEISISNISGNIVFSDSVYENSISINTESFYSGIYIITIKIENVVVTKKLIIIH